MGLPSGAAAPNSRQRGEVLQRFVPLNAISINHSIILFLVVRLSSTVLQIVARLGSIILAVLTLWYGLALLENQSLDIKAGQFNTPTIRFSALAGIILLQMYLIFKVISQEISRSRETVASVQPVPKAKVAKKDKPKKSKLRGLRDQR